MSPSVPSAGSASRSSRSRTSNASTWRSSPRNDGARAITSVFMRMGYAGLMWRVCHFCVAVAGRHAFSLQLYPPHTISPFLWHLSAKSLSRHHFCRRRCRAPRRLRGTKRIIIQWVFTVSCPIGSPLPALVTHPAMFPSSAKSLIFTLSPHPHCCPTLFADESRAMPWARWSAY